MASFRPHNNAEVIPKIQNTLESIVDGLLREEEVAIPLKLKNPPGKQPSPLATEISNHWTSVSFPARTFREAWRFSVLLRILELIHEALSDNVVVSKRNIYYKDPALFKSQMVVDRYVDILAYTFGVSRRALNVTAAAKGLVAGDFTLRRTDGSAFHRDPDMPHLIDDPHELESVDISDVAWILVIEKESTFRTLVSSKLHRESTIGKGVILTAKGYPDISTRSFLRLLSSSHHPDLLPPPIYVLADFDPDGLAIMSTYKYGSFNLSHENANLNVPSIQWLGMRSRDIPACNGNDDKGLLRLSGRDRKRATTMLENSPIFEEHGEEQEWRQELQVMLMLNVKAEMEVLADRDGGVQGYVEERLVENSIGLAF